VKSVWYEVENGSLDKPADVDTTSSKVCVYVRRNFELVPETEDMPAHYKWEEMKIPKEMWGVSQSVMAHDTALNDVYDALTELAEIIAEE
jgi:hypothetical protein